MRSIPNKSIRTTPANTVAPVTEVGQLAKLASVPLADVCDIVEFRLDGLVSHARDALACMQSLPLPCLATARHPLEGGAAGLDKETRIGLLTDSLPFAAIIDVEIRTLPEAQVLADSAATADILVLGSFHDFERTPSLPELSEQARRGLDNGATALKFATRLNAPVDLFCLIELMQTFAETAPVSVMGMGPLGRVSRLLAAQCGSFLNYGYLFESNASGQWPAAELKRLIAECTKPS